jgi:hypothetical protein
MFFGVSLGGINRYTDWSDSFGLGLPVYIVSFFSVLIGLIIFTKSGSNRDSKK